MKQPSPPVADSRGPYKVFVSSTFLDNQERRKLVQDAITMAGMVWHGMEIFTASTRPTVEECLRCARESVRNSILSHPSLNPSVPDHYDHAPRATSAGGN